MTGITTEQALRKRVADLEREASTLRSKLVETEALLRRWQTIYGDIEDHVTKPRKWWETPLPIEEDIRIKQIERGQIVREFRP